MGKVKSNLKGKRISDEIEGTGVESGRGGGLRGEGRGGQEIT